MNRRGFLSLFSAAPAVAMLPTVSAEKSTQPPEPAPEPEFVVACNGPTCRGPQWGSYTLNRTAYGVPQSQCACARIRARDQETINLLRSASITP
jgi:hypothetical protein